MLRWNRLVKCCIRTWLCVCDGVACAQACPSQAEQATLFDELNKLLAACGGEDAITVQCTTTSEGIVVSGSQTPFSFHDDVNNERSRGDCLCLNEPVVRDAHLGEAQPDEQNTVNTASCVAVTGMRVYAGMVAVAVRSWYC